MSTTAVSLKLNKHQLQPLTKLTSKPKQHGILVYHKTGTGKTLTALNIIRTLQKPTIIVIPTDLHNVWLNEIQKYNLLNINNYITFTNYKNLILPNNINDYIIIFDEIHNVSSIYSDSLQKKLNNAYKVIGLTATPIYNNDIDLRIIINIVGGKEILPIYNNTFIEKFYNIDYKNALVCGWLIPLFYSNTILGTIHSILMNTNLDKNETRNRKSKINEYIKMYYNLFTELGIPILYHENILNFIPLFLPYLSIIMFSMPLASCIMKFKKPNISKIYDTIKDYISYYDTKKDSNYPVIQSENIVYTNYNTKQLQVWLDLLKDSINIEDFKKMESKQTLDMNLFDTYINVGLKIGNEFNTDKFYKIIDLIKNEQTVIYSSYSKSINTLYSFLLKNNIKTSILKTTNFNQALLDFKNKKIQVILLTPEFSEGISIFGARQLHILEPVNNYAKYLQIIGRVIRYKSHSHLPINQRNISIYTHIMGANNIINQLKYIIKYNYVYIKEYIKKNLYVYYPFLEFNFTDKLTPDQLMYNEFKQNKTLLIELQKKIESNN